MIAEKMIPPREKLCPSLAVDFHTNPAYNRAMGSLRESSSRESSPQEMSLEALSHRCAAETERFFRRTGGHDNQYCFELWRRAFADRNEAAWAQLYQQYHSLVIGWITDHPQYTATDEEPGYFLNAVFMSMWKSCPPERFSNFGDLPAILAYLKSCVHTTIVNHLRKRRIPHVTMADEIMGHQPIDGGTDEGMAVGVLNQMARTELWHLLNSLLHNEKEQLLTELYFIQGLKPRAIYAQHTDRFASIQEVYRVKQNLLERLSRNDELQRVYNDLREN